MRIISSNITNSTIINTHVTIYTHVSASDCALKARRTAPYAICSRLCISYSISTWILWNGADGKNDLPFPATRPPAAPLVYTIWGLSSSVPALVLTNLLLNYKYSSSCSNTKTLGLESTWPKKF